MCHKLPISPNVANTVVLTGSKKAMLLEVTNVLFHFDSCVFLPAGPGGSSLTDADIGAALTEKKGLAIIETTLRFAKQNAGKKMLIAGHTDISGSPKYNLKLSALRGLNIMYFLTGKKSDWVKITRKKEQVEDYQQIFKWVASVLGWPCDPGIIDNLRNPQTIEATKSFQSSYNADFGGKLKVDGKVGKNTWGAIYDVMESRLAKAMGCEVAQLSQWRSHIKFVDNDRKVLACGEEFPRVGLWKSPEDRRVELLFFDGGEAPKLKGKPVAGLKETTPCLKGACALYDTPRRYSFEIIPGLTELRWDKKAGSCGDEVFLQADTNMSPGTAVEFVLTAAQGSSPKLAGFNATVGPNGKINHKWNVKDVDFKDAATFLQAVVIEAAPKDSKVVFAGAATLKVNALLDTDEGTFTATRHWSGFTMKPKFKQKIEKFKCKVSVKSDIIKAWGGYWVNLSSAGIAGTAGGCPWAGYRWGRATGANPAQPNQYYDGANWKNLPGGFNLTGTNHSAHSFYKSGATFKSVSGTGTWPEAFAEYNFDSATYTNKRNSWITDTHNRWSDKFHIRRKDCQSDVKTRCCRYDVDVTLTLNKVNAPTAETIAVCPGNLRSNASNWFMDDPDIWMAAHEVGHHLDCPDEYAGGGVDTGVPDGDGLVNGLDATTLMAGNHPIKKRHYKAIATMVKRLIKAKYKREYDYESVNK